MTYELRPIPDSAPESMGGRYIYAIYEGSRWVYRFDANGMRHSATGVSFAEQTLRRLNAGAAA